MESSFLYKSGRPLPGRVRNTVGLVTFDTAKGQLPFPHAIYEGEQCWHSTVLWLGSVVIERAERSLFPRKHKEVVGLLSGLLLDVLSNETVASFKQYVSSLLSSYDISSLWLYLTKKLQQTVEKKKNNTHINHIELIAVFSFSSVFLFSSY